MSISRDCVKVNASKNDETRGEHCNEKLREKHWEDMGAMGKPLETMGRTLGKYGSSIAAVGFLNVFGTRITHDRSKIQHCKQVFIDVEKKKGSRPESRESTGDPQESWGQTRKARLGPSTHWLMQLGDPICLRKKNPEKRAAIHYPP